MTTIVSMSGAPNGGAAQPTPTSASASTLILLQASARALTFVLNQLLVRLVSPSIFGLANIQLELLLSTILFLSRDGIRTILIRNDAASTPASASKDAVTNRTGPKRGTTNSVHNIALLPIPIGFLFTVVASSVYALYISPAAMRDIPTFYTSIGLYAVGALSELAYEPLLIRAVRLDQPTLRVKAEGAAVFMKVLSTIATILALPLWSSAPSSVRSIIEDEKAVALLAFGIGQASFGLTMLAVHLAHFVARYSVGATLQLYAPLPERIVHVDPKSRKTKTEAVWLDRPTLSLCMAMAQQGILKHGLTEADKFAVAKYAPLEDQGGYALASNYGSLVARILFQPVEETARIVFSSELVALDADSTEQDVAKAGVPAQTLDRVSSMLSALFRMHMLLACLMTTFGAPLSTAFLYIMAGPRWALETSAPAILSAYTFYLPVMGINGIVEGFLQSVASQKQVKKYNGVLLAASAGFIAVLAAINTLVAGGGTGNTLADSFWAKTALVWANVLSLAVRAGWCWSFVIMYFKLAGASRKGKAESSVSNSIDLTSCIRPSAALPSNTTLALFSLIAVALRAGVPRFMPTNAELLHVSASSDGASRLEAVRLLLPTLAFAAACLAVALCTVGLLERAALVRSLRSLAQARSTPNPSAVELDSDPRKTQ